MVAVAPVAFHGLIDGVENRETVGVFVPPLPGVTPPTMVVAVLEAALGVTAPKEP